MESVQSALAQIFACQSNLGNSQWYCLDIEAQHLGGLSNLLHMTSDAYHAMVMELGWVKRFKGRHGVSHALQRNTVDAFFRSKTILYEVSKTKIPSASKRYHFLRLGPFTNAGLKPSDQFDGRRLPRASIDRCALDTLKDTVNRVPRVSDPVNAKEDELMGICDNIEGAEDTADRKSLRFRLHNELDDLVDALDPSVIQSFKVGNEGLQWILQRLLSQRRWSQVRQASIACGSKILHENVDYNPDRFKVLQELGAPIDCRYLAYVVQDILELERLTNSSILSLVKAGNGREAPCVVIQKNSKKNCATVDFVLQHSAMTPGSMAVHLLRQDKEGVVDALKKEGLQLFAGPMSALTTQAMANAANLGDNSLAMVRRFLRLHYKTAIVASKDALRAISGSKGLEPECRSAMVAKRRRT
jgi:hypothetical protein